MARGAHAILGNALSQTSSIEAITDLNNVSLCSNMQMEWPKLGSHYFEVPK